MIRELSVLCGAIGAIGLTAATAAAAESGFYVGVNAGLSKTDFDQAPLDAAVAAAWSATPISGVSEFDNSDVAWGFFGGYRLNRYVAIEGGYESVGQSKYVFSGLRGHVPNAAPILRFSSWYIWESKGWTLSGIGSIPLGERFDVHARAGVYFAETTLDYSLTTPAEASADSEELTYGLGVGYTFAIGFNVSVDYFSYQDVGTEVTGESNADGAQLSLSYRF